MASSALVVIGNEILSGKIVDTNDEECAGLLRQGKQTSERFDEIIARLAEIAVVPDEVDRIAEAVHRVAERNDYVFTSGGVGPTHDDVTMEGIAAAFSVEIVRNQRL